MNFNLRTLVLPLAVGLPMATTLAMSPSKPTTEITSSQSAATSSDEVKYNGPLDITIGTRIDYQRMYQKSDLLKDQTGFKGNNLIINIQGNMTEKISYRFRHRIQKTQENSNFFDGTDYMWLQYSFNKHWDIRAGKVAIEHGSIEYQLDPYDNYVFSDFWNYPACYLFGVNLGYNFSDRDRLVLQGAESSFRNKENPDLYSYALSWYGNHGWFHNIYTVNMTEYSDGHFVCYFSLGNQFDLGKFQVNLDYMNRITDSGKKWKDCTVRGELKYRPCDNFMFTGFGTYSVNKTHDLGVGYIPIGTEMTRWGSIFEFTPIPKIDKNLILHFCYSYGYGHEGVKNEEPSQNRHYFTAGLHWKIDVVDLVKKMWKKI